MSSITLDAAVIGPLRNALYSQLAIANDELEALLVLAERERNTSVRDAYRALCAAGSLLDAIGWLEQDSSDTLTISCKDQARLILDALELECSVEREQAQTLRSFGDGRGLAEAERRCTAARNAAHTAKAAATTARLLDTERS